MSEDKTEQPGMDPSLARAYKEFDLNGRGAPVHFFKDRAVVASSSLYLQPPVRTKEDLKPKSIGKGAIYHTVTIRKTGVIPLLVEQGADPNAHPYNAWGETAAHLAARIGLLDILVELKTVGVNLNDKHRSRHTPIDLLVGNQKALEKWIENYSKYKVHLPFPTHKNSRFLEALEELSVYHLEKYVDGSFSEFKPDDPEFFEQYLQKISQVSEKIIPHLIQYKVYISCLVNQISPEKLKEIINSTDIKRPKLLRNVFTLLTEKDQELFLQKLGKDDLHYDLACEERENAISLKKKSQSLIDLVVDTYQPSIISSTTCSAPTSCGLSAETKDASKSDKMQILPTKSETKDPSDSDKPQIQTTEPPALPQEYPNTHTKWTGVAKSKRHEHTAKRWLDEKTIKGRDRDWITHWSITSSGLTEKSIRHHRKSSKRVLNGRNKDWTTICSTMSEALSEEAVSKALSKDLSEKALVKQTLAKNLPVNLSKGLSKKSQHQLETLKDRLDRRVTNNSNKDWIIIWSILFPTTSRCLSKDFRGHKNGLKELLEKAAGAEDRKGSWITFWLAMSHSLTAKAGRHKQATRRKLDRRTVKDENDWPTMPEDLCEKPSIYSNNSLTIFQPALDKLPSIAVEEGEIVEPLAQVFL